MAAPYTRAPSDGFAIVDEWADGFGWRAHPDEPGTRTSHAAATDNGVWLFDPLDAPGIDERIAELGTVAGVAVLADYHTRDAAAFAHRYDVPVTVPAWLSRPPDRLTVPVERVDASVAGFELRPLRPLCAWRETVAYRERDGTLYAPDFLSTHPKFTVGDERLGMPTFSRLSPPTERFDCAPARILLGHGNGVFEDATAHLRRTLSGARRRFPRALVRNLPGEIYSMTGAFRD
jgi:hypothetical protein